MARKTDYYTGGNKGDAERVKRVLGMHCSFELHILFLFNIQILLEKFRKHQKAALQRVAQENEEREEQERRRKERLRKKQEEEKQKEAQIQEVTDEEAAKIQQEIDEKVMLDRLAHQ